MQKYILLTFFLFSALLVIGQGSEERKIGSFNKVKAGQAIKVYLYSSNEEKIRVESKNVDLDEILTEVEDNRLVISLEGNRYNNINVEVHVYFKTLTGISASSASSVICDHTLRGDNFEITVSSAASVEVRLDVKELKARASSSGDARLSGRAHEIEIEVSSAGAVDASDLESEIADVRASSAGNARIYVTKALTARASSGGSIRYSGSPQRSNTDSSSGGSVRKAG